jgi:hypothetical protein
MNRLEFVGREVPALLEREKVVPLRHPKAILFLSRSRKSYRDKEPESQPPHCEGILQRNPIVSPPQASLPEINETIVSGSAPGGGERLAGPELDGQRVAAPLLRRPYTA